MNSYSTPLQVVEFVATRMSDPERGPLLRINTMEAGLRLIADGEIVWVYGPRRHELATVVVDEKVPRGGVILRDVAGVAPSEMVTIVKVGRDRAQLR